MLKFKNIFKRFLPSYYRYLLVGYKVTDYKQLYDTVFDTKAHKISLRNFTSLRKYVAAALPMHIQNVSPFVADNTDTINRITSACKRYLKRPPIKKHGRDHRLFVRNWLHNNIDPLPPDYDVSYATYRDHLPLPEKQKKEFDLAYQNYMYKSTKRIAGVKSFIKVEAHEEPKIPRTINARSIYAKVKFGPYIHAIEEYFYDQTAYFSKHIPVPDRARIIQTKFAPYPNIYCGDYTAYESLMDKEMMDVCEKQLVSYMLQNVPKGKVIATEFNKMVSGRNKTKCRDIWVECDATRMSGELSTSLGNGFTNLMCILYILWNKYKRPSLSEFPNQKDLDVIIEGDDSVIGYTGDFPLLTQDFEDVGLWCKLDKHETPETTRFCQVAFAKDDLENIAKIRRVIQKAFFTMANKFKARPSKLMGLLQAKARSLIYEFPACPIVTQMAKMMLRCSYGYEPEVFDKRKYIPTLKEIQILLDNHKFTEHSRLLVEKEQHIPRQTQIELEHYFDKITTCQIMNIDQFNLFPPIVYYHYNKFVEVVKSGSAPLWD